MTVHNLLIKGNVEDATKECAKRLPERTKVKIIKFSSSYMETFVKVWNLPSDSTAVSEWFQDSPAIMPGFGFPNGTLLHFSITEE